MNATRIMPPAAFIETIERHVLDRQPIPSRPIFGLIEAAHWRRIAGLAKFWSPHRPEEVLEAIEDMLLGLHGTGANLWFLMHTFRGALDVLFGVREAKHVLLLESALRGALPGAEILSAPPGLGRWLKEQGAFTAGHQITGVPALKLPRARGAAGPDQPGPAAPRIDRLAQGMGRARWLYVVEASPIANSAAADRYSNTLEVLHVYDQQAREQRAVTAEITHQGDRRAAQCVSLLERQLERLERGRRQGLWSVKAGCYGADAATGRQVAGMLRGLLGGPDSTPEPLRVREYDGVAAPAGWPDELRASELHSGELSALMQVPLAEAPGYPVQEYARFDLALPTLTAPAAERLTVGEVLDGAQHTGQQLQIERDVLTRHVLVAGVTGSGKSNTCLHLLAQLWAGGTPFLVIEPAKAEYRALLHRIPQQLRVYTLGDERYAPFRLNPFEFACGSLDARVHVQTHIDYLKSVFNAAFVLYAPMPYVLEMCLHKVYTDRGWNLTTSAVEQRMPAGERGSEARYADTVFPTLQDLHDAIDPVVDALGYDERIRQDVKAGLKARIASLLLGGKGLMLNTRRSVSVEDLLRAPAVLELERIGDDAEKAFVIGLLLTQIYEHRAVEGRIQGTSDRLRHLLVIEEAHRLLQNVATGQDTERANPQGKAVETFATMLAEIRAYGQGVLIAEQLPSKLTPDALKNTSTKILHRMVARDERETLAGAMNLDEAQQRAIVGLRRGLAAVFTEGADRPFLVEVLPAKGASAEAPPSDALVRAQLERMQGLSEEVYQPRLGCAQCRLWRDQPDVCARTRDLALLALQTGDAPLVFERYARTISADESFAVNGFAELRMRVRQAAPGADEGAERSLTLCFGVHAADRYVERLGRYHTIGFDRLRELQDALVAVLAQLSKLFPHQGDAKAMNLVHVAVQPAVSRLSRQLAAASGRAYGPYHGCARCRAKCHYGAEMASVLADPVLRREALAALQSPGPDQVMWGKLAGVALVAAERIVGVDGPGRTQAALCFGAQIGPALGFSRHTQLKLARALYEVLDTPRPGGPKGAP